MVKRRFIVFWAALAAFWLIGLVVAVAAHNLASPRGLIIQAAMGLFVCAYGILAQMRQP
ncbi:MAG TPA: hypothetical protein VIG51_09440 [Candidatus Baltobacteraceae bacterium]|jgi:hypothetical protein